MPKFCLPLIGLISSLLCSSLASAEIYKTVDKDGRITFSDTPPPHTNAEPIELKSLNTTPPPVEMSTQFPSAQPDYDNHTYQIQLTAPINGATLMPNERSIVISANVTPNLQDGDMVAFKLDGQVMAKTNETVYTLVEPPRGEHSVSVAIIDGDGNEIAQSDAASFVVMRPLIKKSAPPVPKK